MDMGIDGFWNCFENNLENVSAQMSGAVTLQVVDG